MSEISAQGTTLSMGSGTPTVIGKITSFKGPGGSASIIDISNLGSTAKEKLMGLPDEGQFSFEINYDSNDTGHMAVIAARAARTKNHFTITLSNADTISFDGYVTEFAVQGAVDAVVAASCSIEITGPVTWPA